MEGWGLKPGQCPTTHSSPKRPHQQWVILRGSASSREGTVCCMAQSSMKRVVPQLSGPQEPQEDWS